MVEVKLTPDVASVLIWQSETLKYLFLLYSDDDVLPLDRYVFNTEVGAIFPVRGVHHS